MTVPIYKLAMGAEFSRLQPELQDYFSLAPGSGHYGVGEGTFDVVGCRQSWLRPLLRLTAGEQAFFPEYGECVPFRIENHAHLDPFGRSSLTARREIFFPGSTRISRTPPALRRLPPRRKQPRTQWQRPHRPSPTARHVSWTMWADTAASSRICTSAQHRKAGCVEFPKHPGCSSGRCACPFRPRSTPKPTPNSGGTQRMETGAATGSR